MYLEAAGSVVVVPRYSHVGYLSAANVGYLRADSVHVQGSPLPSAAMLMLAVGCALATTRSWRRTTPARRRLLVLLTALFASAGGVAFGVMRYGSEQRRMALAFETETTLELLEYLVPRLDAWTAEHGRAPDAAEWREFAKLHGAVDGWGVDLAYVPDDGWTFDGRPYRLASERWRREPTDTWGSDLTSTMLGRDGLFGTLDDSPELRALARDTGLDPTQGDVPRWRQR